jgi:hypothetical protein
LLIDGRANHQSTLFNQQRINNPQSIIINALFAPAEAEAVAALQSAGVTGGSLDSVTG